MRRISATLRACWLAPALRGGAWWLAPALRGGAMSACASSAALALLLVATACGSDTAAPRDGDDAGDVADLPWYGRTRGGAVVLSRDERVAVVANRSAGVVTVFELDADARLERLVRGRTDLDLGAGSEPWAAVIGGDDDSAYVISRSEQTVTRLVDLHDGPRIDGVRQVGSEPTAIAIDPAGVRVYVANWGDGTISVLNTPDFEVKMDTLDLNAALAGTGVLGDVAPRLGLAHPRALAFTDDGDDDVGDEILYATEFFSMPRPEAGSEVVPGYFDRNRQGFVYPIPIGQGRVGDPIAIAPVDDTGFADSNGAVTGCFPNQLYAATVDDNRLFVTSMCASPEGPLGPSGAANIKTVVHPVVFVIDTRTGAELPDLRQVLTHELEPRYAEDMAVGGGAMAVDARMPLIPNDIAFAAPGATSPDAPRRGCLTAMGADAVFCIDHDDRGRLLEIGAPGARYVDLAAPGQHAGLLPVGLALSRRRAYALVASDKSQALSVVDLETNTVRMVSDAIAVPRAAGVRDSAANDGRHHFATGRDVWSLDGQAWVSCESCHPDGLSDGVTWFFSRGPRRTPSTAGSYYGDGERRVLLWTANIDEVHDVEVIVRTVAGGVGAIVWKYPTGRPEADLRILYDGGMSAGQSTSTLRNNLNGSLEQVLEPAASSDEICDASTATCDHSPVDDWDEIDAFVRSVRAPRRPAALEAAQVERGADLFREGRCASCHGGPGFTLSRVFYTPSPAENGALPYSRPDAVSDAQLGRLRLETYDVPTELRALNPPGSSGSATFRRWDPPEGRDRVVHLYGTEADDGYNSAATHGGDQINCVLRAVGTFPSQQDGRDDVGIVADPSAVVVRELRQDMSTVALGATGFNVPSLLGLAAGAPYLHAGNARSLEELFAPAFAAHYQAAAPGFLDAADAERDGNIRDLVAYLLSIDDDRPNEAVDPQSDLCGAGVDGND